MVHGSQMPTRIDHWMQDWKLTNTAAELCGWCGDSKIGYTCQKGWCRDTVEVMKTQLCYGVDELIRIEEAVLKTMADWLIYLHNIAVIGGYTYEDHCKDQSARECIRARLIMHTDVSQRYHALALTKMDITLPLPDDFDEDESERGDGYDPRTATGV